MKNLFLIIILFCLSCKENHNDSVELIKISPKEYNVNNLLKDIKKYSKQISKDKVIFVPLETNDNCLIGSIDKIFIINDNYFIVDKKNSKGIFVFDNSGKFLFKIQNTGLAEGEFTNINDVTYNSFQKEIKIFDSDRKKIISYDINGNFVKEISTELFFTRFFSINNSFYLYTKFMPNFNKTAIDYRLIKTDNKGHIKKYFLEFDKKIQSQTILSLKNNFYFNSSSNKLYFFESFNNIIYKITNNTIEKNIKLDFNNNTIPQDIFKHNKNFTEYINKNNLAYLNNVLLISDEIIKFSYSFKVNRLVEYNRLKNTYNEYLAQFIKEDSIYLRTPILYNKQTSVSILEPVELFLNKKTSFINKYKIKEFDNPILVLINEK